MSLEATPMKHNRVISTAVLLLLLGTTIPAFAQKGEEEKGGGGGKASRRNTQAQPQHAQKAQPQQHAQKAQPQQRAQQAQPQQRAQKAQPQQRTESAAAAAQKAQQRAAAQRSATEAQQPDGSGDRPLLQQRNGGDHYGRISDTSYRAHFGHGHSFHMGHPQMIGGYNRFQYGGYWFGYNQGWPVGWGYNDDCLCRIH